MSDNSHVRCKVGIVVWGRMYGNRELGGEPGSLLLYIIVSYCFVLHLLARSCSQCCKFAEPRHLLQVYPM